MYSIEYIYVCVAHVTTYSIPRNISFDLRNRSPDNSRSVGHSTPRATTPGMAVRICIDGYIKSYNIYIYKLVN